jgi:hypothetical protein
VVAWPSSGGVQSRRRPVGIVVQLGRGFRGGVGKKQEYYNILGLEKKCRVVFVEGHQNNVIKAHVGRQRVNYVTGQFLSLVKPLLLEPIFLYNL